MIFPAKKLHQENENESAIQKSKNGFDIWPQIKAPTWRIPFCKWLVTMVSNSSKWGWSSYIWFATPLTNLLTKWEKVQVPKGVPDSPWHFEPETPGLEDEFPY